MKALKRIIQRRSSDKSEHNKPLPAIPGVGGLTKADVELDKSRPAGPRLPRLRANSRAKLGDNGVYSARVITAKQDFGPENAAYDGSIRESPQGTRLPSLYVSNFTLNDIGIYESGLQEQRGREIPLPVEVWEEIFRLATVIPGKEEFIMDAESYSPMVCDSPKELISFKSEEYTWAIKTRYSIALVCKLWYGIAMPMLWSNFRINLSASCEYIQFLNDKIRDHPEIATRISRLELIPHFRQSYGVYHESKQIPHHLPSLKILECTIAQGEIAGHIQPEVLILKRDRSSPHRGSPIVFCWQNVRVLHISFGYEYLTPYQPNTISFPNLQDLYVRQEGGIMAEYISNYWDTPSLCTLSIHGSHRDETIWFKFLSRCGDTLEKLELNVRLRNHPPPSIPVPEMERLLVLYVAPDFSKWFDVLSAPQLRRIGLFGSISTPWVLPDGRAVEELFSLFPTVQELSLHRVQRSVFTRPGGTFDIYLKDWLQRGVVVDVWWR